MHAIGSSRSSVGSDTVVAFINSDLVLQEFEPMNTLLKLLGHSDRLELMAAPQKPFQKFVPTGKTSKDFFVVGTGTDVLENGEKYIT